MISRLILACAVTIATMTAVGCKSPYVMTVEDRVFVVGESGKIVGKLELKGISLLNRSVEDRDLIFFVDGKEVGAEETNDEGFAKLEWRFGQFGSHHFRVVYRNDTAVMAEAAATVYVWKENDPIIVVDIDGTISLTQKRSLLSRSSEDRSQPMPRSAEALQELSRYCNIVYLTARPKEYFAKTRHWLRINAFPEGPLLTWDIDSDEWSWAEFKEDRLDDLTDIFGNVRVGIGNADSDVEAYQEEGLFCIMITPGEPISTVDGVTRVPGWTSVENLFRRNRILLEGKLSPNSELKLR